MHLTAFLGGHPGLPELLLVLLVILLLFGAKRLPDLARSLGKSLSEFRKGRAEGLKEDLSADAPGDEEAPPDPGDPGKGA